MPRNEGDNMAAKKTRKTARDTALEAQIAARNVCEKRLDEIETDLARNMLTPKQALSLACMAGTAFQRAAALAGGNAR
jgi:hypothetical protein